MTSMGDIPIIGEERPRREVDYAALFERLSRPVRNLADKDPNTFDEDEDMEAYRFFFSEQDTLFYVRHGMVEHLNTTTGPVFGFAGGEESVDVARNILIILTALCMYASVDGGLPARVASAISAELMRTIKSCGSVDELQQLADDLTIPMGFCMFVREFSLPSSAEEDISKALRYLADHIHEKVRVSDVSQHVGLTPEYLSEKFHREVGLTISGYLTMLRILEAKAMLRFTTLSIAELAQRLSYSSQSYFQTVFKRETGVTPQQYRKMNAR